MGTKNTLAEYGDVLLPKDVQNILHIGRNTVYRLLEDGSIKSIKIGNSYRIPKSNLTAFLYPSGIDDTVLP